MRRSLTCALIVAFLAIGLNPARATTADLSRWFLQATAFDAPGTFTKMAKPDFMPGDTLESMSRNGGSEFHPLFVSFPWQLVKYDRKHHIALATTPHTDNAGVALFEASKPAIAVPDADLSHYSTGRGLHIGSTFESVRAAYGGPPAKQARHFVVSYSAEVPSVTENEPPKPVNLLEHITLVIDDGRVSSITISISL
jgi:hypothetical protein